MVAHPKRFTHVNRNQKPETGNGSEGALPKYRKRKWGRPKRFIHVNRNHKPETGNGSEGALPTCSKMAPDSRPNPRPNQLLCHIFRKWK